MYSQFCERRLGKDLPNENEPFGSKVKTQLVVVYRSSEGSVLQFFPWNGIWSATPRFPLEDFGQKRSSDSSEKILENVCLISWIVTINIPNHRLPLRVYIFI